jgi:hypothetical protein
MATANRITLVLGALMVPVLLGCSTTYYGKPGFSQAQFQQDMAGCAREVTLVGLTNPVAGLFHRRTCMEAKGYSVGSQTEVAHAVAQRQAASQPTKTPFEALTEARRQWTRDLLTKIDRGDCFRLLPCLTDYEDTVRTIGRNVGYTFVSADELLFRAAREIASSADDGTITQAQAVNRLLALDVSIDEIYRSLQIERARQGR